MSGDGPNDKNHLDYIRQYELQEEVLSELRERLFEAESEWQRNWYQSMIDRIEAQQRDLERIPEEN
jgi:hypothetical protein